MKPTNKPRTLLEEAAVRLGPTVRDPRAFVLAQLRNATPEELLAELIERATSDSEVRRQLLAAAKQFKARPGLPGRLPKAETLLIWFEQHQAAVQEFLESGKLDSSWPWPQDPYKATLEWFSKAFKVQPDSVTKAVGRAKLKRGDQPTLVCPSKPSP